VNYLFRFGGGPLTWKAALFIGLISIFLTLLTAYIHYDSIEASFVPSTDSCAHIWWKERWWKERVCIKAGLLPT